MLNSRGGRLSDRSVRTIIGRFGELAGLDDPLEPHDSITPSTPSLVRGSVDVVTIAELMGHARLETTRI